MRVWCLHGCYLESMTSFDVLSCHGALLKDSIGGKQIKMVWSPS